MIVGRDAVFAGMGDFLLLASEDGRDFFGNTIAGRRT